MIPREFLYYINRNFIGKSQKQKMDRYEGIKKAEEDMQNNFCIISGKTYPCTTVEFETIN